MADDPTLQILLILLAVAAVLVALILFLRRNRAGPEAPAEEPAVVLPEQIPSPFLAAPEGEADDLRKIKGIGPKLETMLTEKGVFHYRQIAAWTPEQLALVDAQLGQFQGRPERDQWQSQARFLAAGDIKGYEAAHGKLGPLSAPGAPGGSA
jgi:predicted flap endonuclease-1-like 5' DNA nuclease